MPLWVTLGVAVTFLVLNVFLGLALPGVCGENVPPGTAQDAFCSTVDSDETRYLVAFFPAGLALLAGLSLPRKWFRATVWLLAASDAAIITAIVLLAT